MMTPFDWQEGIGHRAQFVEARLSSGVPVVAVSCHQGIIIATFRLQSRKLYEIYDRMAFAGVGLASDIEAVRIAAIDFCHQEGFQRSEGDVTIQRIATVLSAPIKQAFGDFRSSPVVVRALFAEVHSTPEKDKYTVIDYDGDYAQSRMIAIAAGSDEAHKAMKKSLDQHDFPKLSQDDVIAELRKAILVGMDPDGESAAQSRLEELTFEAVLLERSSAHQRRFKILFGQEE